MFKKNVLALLIPTIIMGCAASRKLNHPTASATLWVQNSAEYDAITILTYRTAASNLALALEDSYWSAALEQKNPYFDLPPAVILDVDETVIDNSPFQARMIKQNSEFKPDAWARWVREANADAVEGALEFAKYAAEKDVTVFYVTNREHRVENSTRKNLQKLGFPLSAETDVILTKNERNEWNSDKTTRRRYITENYRVLMIIGDDLNDFTNARFINVEKRNAIVENFKEKWGRQWYILPNPIYGSWQQALYNFNDSLNDEEKRDLMEDKLKAGTDN